MSAPAWSFIAAVSTGVIALLGNIWVELRRSRKNGEATAQAQLGSAVVELLTRSAQMQSRVHQVLAHSRAHTSVGGLFDHLLRAKVPMDWPQLFEPMNKEMEHMMRAQAQLWLANSPKRCASETGW